MSEFDLEKIVRRRGIQSLAKATFGSSSMADRWLRNDLAVLGGETPLSLLDSAEGELLVETILAKIAWGAAT